MIRSTSCSPQPCPHCGCRDDVEGTPAHAVLQALVVDDVDRALSAGLLTCAACAGCTPACAQLLAVARADRQRALAARDRYRARNARLQRRAEQRALLRGAAPPAAQPPIAQLAASSAPGLPPAAAAALARARARAAGKPVR